MWQLQNELIASPYDRGLLGARHSDTNDVIISDTMLCSLSPPQLRTITYNHKMMCGCVICNTSKYFQESLNVWRRKQLKIMKDKANNSRGREKDELTQAYKSYADYTFPNNETRHPRWKMQHILFFAHRLMMNVNCLIVNMYCGSVLPITILIYQELKLIHRTEHKWLRLTHMWLNLLVHIMAS